MIPVAFNGCAGWFYPARNDVATGRGVVICEPFGYEALCSQRAVLTLAQMLADAGLPTLRFHYPGTGDSSGDESQDQTERWIDSIGDASAYLREISGVSEVALCGLRLGGMLAVEAARRFGDIAALALLAPVLSGRSYVRELMLSGSMVAGYGVTSPAEGLDVLGYRLTAGVMDRLRGMDLRATFGAGAAPRILVLAPEEAPPSSDPTVEVRLFKHYDGLTQHTEYVHIPVQALAETTDWLRMDAPASDGKEHAGPAAALLELAPDIIEQPVQFGRDVGLFGVLSQRTHDRHEYAVLILNTGLNHHTGNGRGSVRLARRLARDGVTALRIDMRGLGESAPADPMQWVGFHDLGRINDVQAALDLLEQAGHSKVLLTGICAGAYIGLHAAAVDERIVATALVNLPYFYIREEDPGVPLWRKPVTITARLLRKTGIWHWHKTGKLEESPVLGARYFNRRRLLSWGLRFMHYGAFWAEQRILAGLRWLVPRSWPVGHIERLFQKLHKRGVDVTMIYADKDWGLIELGFVAGKRHQRLSERGWATIKLIEKADHTMTSSWMQDAYAGLVEEQLGIGTAPVTTPADLHLRAE